MNKAKNIIRKINTDKKYIKIKLYIISGVITTAISWISYKILLVLNIQYILAFTISWLLAVSYAFISTRKKVYESKSNSKKDVAREYIRFCLGRTVTYGINVGMLFILVDLLHFDAFYSNCLITVVIIILNFFMGNISINKKWRL